MTYPQFPFLAANTPYSKVKNLTSFKQAATTILSVLSNFKSKISNFVPLPIVIIPSYWEEIFLLGLFRDCKDFSKSKITIVCSVSRPHAAILRPSFEKHTLLIPCYLFLIL